MPSRLQTYVAMSISVVKACPHCCRKVRLSPFSRRFRRQSPFSATVALFCDSVDRALLAILANSHMYAVCYSTQNYSALHSGSQIVALIATGKMIKACMSLRLKH